MKKTILTLVTGTILFSSCQKEDIKDLSELMPEAIALPCITQTEDPAGRTYDYNSIVDITCKEKHCGIMPLSSKSYWVYRDSIFDNGTFLRVQMDTLRYTGNVKSSDGLVWWDSELYVGLPQRLYTNESAIFLMQQRQYSPDLVDAKKEYSLFPGDSVLYLTGFDDIAAFGRSLKMKDSFSVPAGDFDGCIYFEKHARNYRKDQVFFKPGVGVLKYIQEKAPMGTRVLKLQQIMTLVAFHIE